MNLDLDRALDEKIASTVAEVVSSKAEVEAAFKSKLASIANWVNRLTIDVDGNKLSVDAVAEVRYNGEDLSGALQEQAEKVAWWGMLTAKLNRMVVGLKANLERVRAQVDSEVRNGQIAIAGGKVTEKAVDSAVTLDKRVINAEDTLAEVQEKLDQVKAVLEAFRHRREAMYIEGLIQNTERRSTSAVIRSQS
jgi:hypothetical protein